MTVIDFIGWSSTGKTTFIEACLRALSAKGLRAAAVKFASHVDEPEGKDATRFRAAGADVALVSHGLAHMTRRTPERWDRDAFSALFPGAEVALVEGSAESGRPLPGAVAVIVAGSARTEAELKRPLEGFDAIVCSDQALAAAAASKGLAVYGSGDAERFLLDCMKGRQTMNDRTVRLVTGGQEVPLSPFVEETIRSVVLGVLAPLKKTDLSGEIVLTIAASPSSASPSSASPSSAATQP